MNRRAVDYSIKVGLALGCKSRVTPSGIAKSYYYPGLAEELSDQPVRSAALL
jgi:Asp-tRNA(Asn)/Glu-tRNA(Gln) amidotransferase B subunit